MTYTLPDGKSLGEVLGVQFSDAAGIATRRNEDGTWELTAWPIALGSEPTQEQVTTWAAVDHQVVRNRRDALAILETERGQLIRAVVLLVLDELNSQATKTNAILNAIDAASTFANLKTRVAAITDYPARTAQQLRTAIEGNINSGDADS